MSKLNPSNMQTIIQTEMMQRRMNRMRLMSLQQRKQPLPHIVHKMRNLIFENKYPGEGNHDHIEDKILEIS